MVELQAILKYQEIDKKLYALERELAGCEERKEYLKKEARDTLTVHYQKEGNREP